MELRDWSSDVCSSDLPSFLRTDILGALHIASQVFAEHVAARQILVIYSDMRNSTPELDLDTPSSVARSARVLRQGNVPAASLLDVTVGALGVDAADRSIAYWQELEEFWTLYFNTVSAELIVYSALRETLQLKATTLVPQSIRGNGVHAPNVQFARIVPDQTNNTWWPFPVFTSENAATVILWDENGETPAMDRLALNPPGVPFQWSPVRRDCTGACRVEARACGMISKTTPELFAPPILVVP